MLKLVIANKLYSSWSLRPWMLMTALGIEFEETVIPLYKPDSKARILDVSPNGKVPCLIDGEIKVWESLAIMEYLHERFPEAGVWPSDRAARAYARAASSEMHAGFQALRQACPMNLTKRFAPKELSSDAQDNVRRLQGMWSDCRRRFANGGDFLFGPFTAADAMFAPVVTRLDTYQIPVATETRQYMNRILAHPAFVKWKSEAFTESWALPHYEEGWTPAEVLYTPAEAKA